jgi:hypothetical protein
LFDDVTCSLTESRILLKMIDPNRKVGKRPGCPVWSGERGIPMMV